MKLAQILVLLLTTSGIYAQEIVAIKKADSLIVLTQYKVARESIESALRKSVNQQTKILLENKRVEILILEGELNMAESALIEIAKLNKDFIDAITATNHGFLYLNKGRYDLAQEKLLVAQQLFQKSGNINTPEGARCLATLGTLYGTTRKYKQSEENRLLALQIREKLFGKESEEVAASYNDLGTLYLESNPDQALEYFEKAYDTYKKIHGNDHPKIAIANTNMGFAYSRLELYGDAINDFEEANRIWQKIYPNGHPNQALVLSFLGQTYRKLKDAKTAEEFFTKSLKMYQKAYGDKHPDISKIYIELGVLHLEATKYDDALNAFQNSIIANAPKFNSTDLTINPQTKDNYSGLGMLYSLKYKSEALESKYYGKTLKRQELLLALSCLHTCDSLIDEIRFQSSAEDDKLALGELANEVYEVGVRISYSLSEMTLKPDAHKEQAFYFAEKSKSAVLQASIADTQAKSFAGIPPALLDEEKNLKAEITLISQQLSQKPDAEKEKKLRETLYNLNVTYNQFIKKLEKDFPNYYNLKFNQQTPSSVDIQNTLDKSTAVISYFIAERNQRIYQFIITKNKFSINNLTLTPDFERTAKGFNNSLYYSNFDVYKKTSSDLSKILIPSLSKSISKLILIPSGRLSTIPFEALAINLKNATEFKDVNYAINRYAMGYAFSAGLLKINANISSQKQNIFLCAPVNFPDKSYLSSLPGSEQEVNTIAALFKQSSTTVKFQDANESTLKSATLSKYNYIHFATHGIVDEVNPELSRIFLNSSKTEDGDLYAGEIYNLNLNAELAVLSACQTGLGKISKGEGVIGLSRALTYAGADNLIVSFWSVSDESTTVLMTEFYKSLLTQQKKDFSSSLRDAKLKLISQEQYASPYYWAPFILIGN